MEVDIKKKKIHLRCSEVAATINCQLALPLKWKLLQEVGEQEPNDAQILGTLVHEHIEEILTKPQHKRKEMCGKVSKILKQPAEFVHLNLNRSQFSASLEELLQKRNCIILCQNIKYTIMLSTFVDSISQIAGDLRAQSSIYNYDFEIIRDGSRIKFISNTRGPKSRLEIHGLSYIMPADGTTIEEGLSLYPSLFGKSLTFLEQKYETEFKLDGWDINFSGTLDATPSIGNPIVDWKTSKTTPPDKVSGRYANYYIQPANYRNLFCKNNNMPISECYMILAFIVKTQRPKFKPICFKLTTNMIMYADMLIKRAAQIIIKYIEEDKLPDPTVSAERCSYCDVRQLCARINPIFPNLVDIEHVISN